MKISVVVPAYNEELLLATCLKSLLAQTHKADEIIVVDNNSTDATRAIAESLNVRIITEPKQGIWAASTRGYDEATGDIIARCDADSVLEPSWLARIEAHMDDPAAAAVTGPGVFYGAPKLLCKLADIFYMKAYFLSVAGALGQRPLFGSNFAMRRSAWIAARPRVHLREDIHDDIDLSYHLPRGAIRYDGSLTAQISIRPLLSFRGLPGRYTKGFRSIFIHWPEHAPWKQRRHKDG